MTSIRKSALACSALALMIAAGPALGQDTPWLTADQPIEGALETGDASGRVNSWSDDPYLYDDYLIRAGEGERYLISLDSEDFDPYLDVYVDGQEGDLEPIFSDDDGGGYPNALLRFTANETGVYRVRVRGFSSSSRGVYTLNMTPRPPAAPEPAPTPINLRSSAEGELTDADPQLDYEEPYDVYVFSAQAGDRIDIRLNSDEFDPILYVGTQDGGRFEELAVNDDGGDGLNSLVRFRAQESRDYVIRAASLGSSGRGAYTLSLEEAPPPPPMQTIQVGQTVTGELTEDAPQSVLGFAHVAYRFTARADQRVAINLSSDDFDTVVQLGQEGASEFELIATDDDGAGDGLNSRLVHTFETAGDYVIHAQAYAGTATGAFTLSIEEIAPPPPPTPIRPGDSVEGEISDQSPEAEYGRRYNAYGFSGREGQRIQATLRSGDFDAYLELGRAGEPFEVLASDDDGLGEGLNSRLNITLPETGDYVIRASPLGSSGRGLYALELVDRGRAPRAGSLVVGSTVRGELSENDNIADGDASYYDEYRFQAREGDRLRITLVSNVFDPLLLFGRGEGDAFEIISTDDDSLSDLNALIETTVEESGWYVVRANSYAPNSTGAYALTVERAED